jgi:hypothetical protein
MTATGTIQVTGLCKTFQAKAETVAALDGVEFAVAAGEIVTLLGPSGCGRRRPCGSSRTRPPERGPHRDRRAHRRRYCGRRLRPRATPQPRDGLPVVCDLAAHERV